MHIFSEAWAKSLLISLRSPFVESGQETECPPRLDDGGIITTQQSRISPLPEETTPSAEIYL